MIFSIKGRYLNQNPKLNGWFYHFIPLILWLVFALMPFIIPVNGNMSAAHHGFALDIFYRNLLILIVFYIHAYCVFPFLQDKRNKGYYFWLLVLLLAGFVSFSEYLRPQHPFFPVNQNGRLLPPGPPFKPNGFFRIFFHLPIFAVAILSSYCYCLLLGFNKREKMLSERENAQLKTELSFLRSQISPHFMFNVLNSIVALARKKSELVEPSLINLSRLMRYMLYERNGNVIYLKTEAEYLTNYIDLQLLRYGNEVNLNMYINGDFGAHQIEPMLLLPFVENAFKHGISMVDDPLIDIFLTVNARDAILRFVVLNSVSPVKDMEKSDTGIGIQNIKRRLELLYPNQHELNLNNQNGLFKAEIIIKLA